MLKTNRFWVVVFCLIIAVCAGMVLYFGELSGGASVAYVYSRGELVESFDLGTVREPFKFVVQSGGGFNTVGVETGRIRVLEADCTGQDCVRQGWVSGGLTPIVCLPHGLVIVTQGNSDVDGVVG